MITNVPSTSGSSSASTTWFPESGASFHVTGDATNIHESLSFDGPEQIFIGNGQGLDIHSSGSSVFSSPIKPQITLTLNHLLHVPTITKNLISVSQFARDNLVFFKFHVDHCVVKSQATEVVLLHGKVGSDGFYTFPSVSFQSAMSSLSLPFSNNASVCNINTSSSTCNNQSSFTSQYLWHLRLGHPNTHTLKLALQHCNILIINKEKDVSNFCITCCMGKAHRLHSPSSETTYNHPLQLVFGDLWGPSPTVSSLEYKYYITFVDAFSRYTWIYLLTSKSDAFLISKQFKVMGKLQLGCPFKALQTDWGGEFRPFTQYLTNLGITHRLICPHTHDQNGVMERKHRHIVDLGLTLLTQASLPLTYWDHAFLTSVYLINILPTSSLQFKIPNQVLFHQQPHYNFLKVFGCVSFPLLRPYNAHKLDFRSHECIFLGYSSSHKGYRCLSPSGHIFISKDVLFNESRFPYPILFTTAPYDPTPIKDASLSSLPLDTSSASTPSYLPTSTLPTSPTPTILSPASAISPQSHTISQSASGSSFSSFSPVIPPINQHPMQTRSRPCIVLPRLNPTLLLMHTEPKSVKQALADPRWNAATKEEFNALHKNHT